MSYIERSKSCLVILIAWALLAPTAFGGDGYITTQGEGRSSVSVEDQAEGLLMQVPRAIPEGGRFLLQFVLNDIVVAEQSVIVRGADQGVTEVLPGARDFMQWLRAVDAKKPGAVMIRVTFSEKCLESFSLTQFETASSAIRTARNTRSGKRLRMTADSACTDSCDQQYDECQAECGPRGSTECDICTQNWMQCTDQCPTCDDWFEESRTQIGRFFSGTSNILGVQYCQFVEFYNVEERNGADCYPNRTVCDTDHDTLFYGFGNWDPSEEQCCASFGCFGTSCS